MYLKLKKCTPFEAVLAIKGSIPSPFPLGSVSSLGCLDAQTPPPLPPPLLYAPSLASRERHKGIIGRGHDLRFYSALRASVALRATAFGHPSGEVPCASKDIATLGSRGFFFLSIMKPR